MKEIVKFDEVLRLVNELNILVFVLEKNWNLLEHSLYFQTFRKYGMCIPDTNGRYIKLFNYFNFSVEKNEIEQFWKNLFNISSKVELDEKSRTIYFL